MYFTKPYNLEELIRALELSEKQAGTPSAAEVLKQIVSGTAGINPIGPNPTEPIPLVQQPQPKPINPAQVPQAPTTGQTPAPKKVDEKGLMLANLLSALAQGIAPQGTWASNLASTASQIGQNLSYRNYLIDLLSGKTNPFQSSPMAVPSPAEAVGLSPEKQQAGVQAKLATDAQRLKEQEAPFDALYKMALASNALSQPELEKARQQLKAIDQQIEVAKLNKKKYQSEKIDLGDKEALLSFDPDKGEYDLKVVMKKGATPTAGEDKEKSAHINFVINGLANSYKPLIENALSAIYPEREAADRLQKLFNTFKGQDKDAIISSLKELSPKLAKQFDQDVSQALSHIEQGGNLSEIQFPVFSSGHQFTLDSKGNLVIPGIDKSSVGYYAGTYENNGKTYYVIYRYDPTKGKAENVFYKELTTK